MNYDISDERQIEICIKKIVAVTDRIDVLLNCIGTLNIACKLTKNANPKLMIYAIHPGWMQSPQGYPGAVEGCLPDQKPADTAVYLFELVRQNEKE